MHLLYFFDLYIICINFALYVFGGNIVMIDPDVHLTRGAALVSCGYFWLAVTYGALCDQDYKPLGQGKGLSCETNSLPSM